MKAVLLSIKPKYVELIASGEKTIEVRKTKPKIETPFKCYIYCTIGNGVKSDYLVTSGIQCGKVIGEFVCDKTEDLRYVPTKYYGQPRGTYEGIICVNSCLTVEKIKEYAKGKPIYGWYITDLKIYDKPKELSEFYPIKPKKIEDWTDKDDCAHCKYHKWVGSMQEYVEKGKPMREKCTLGKPEPICEYTPPITRPPQSWCYVEEKDGR